MKQHLARAFHEARAQSSTEMAIEVLVGSLQSQGFTIVPIEPSKEMVDAAEWEAGSMRAAYKAMLKAHEGQDK